MDQAQQYIFSYTFSCISTCRCLSHSSPVVETLGFKSGTWKMHCFGNTLYGEVKTENFKNGDIKSVICHWFWSKDCVLKVDTPLYMAQSQVPVVFVCFSVDTVGVRKNFFTSILQK